MNDNINQNRGTAIPANKDIFTLDRSFILTTDKMLATGMTYLYNEGNHSVAVRLIEVWNGYDMEDEFVYLTLQELQTNRIFNVSWNLDYDGSYYLWTLADYETLTNLPL